MFTECPAGLYGHDCQESCSTHCIASGTCDRVTGQCDGGCQAGWKESKCDKSRSIPLFVKCKKNNISMRLRQIDTLHIRMYSYLSTTSFLQNVMLSASNFLIILKKKEYTLI